MELSFFAAMAWKSALIAGAALMLAYGLRSRSAADRALVLRLGVTMLLLLPLLAIGLPSLEIVAFAAPEAAPTPGLNYPAPELQLAALAGGAGVAGAPTAPEPTIWDDPTPLVLLAYLGGLAMVGSRLLAGLLTLRRWTRSAREVTCPEWLAAFDRARWMLPDPDLVRLMVADEVGSPLSWGWRRPVILIDPDTLLETEDAEAILAHEVAHVARRDWPALILSRLAATLFWFNPLVWRLEREVVQQAEEAADCEAAERVEPARYAETLLSWARVDPALPAHGIAPSASALGRRVRAILDRRIRERPSGSAWTAMAMLLCVAIAAPVAAMELVAAQPEAPEAPEAPDAPAAPEPPAAPPVAVPPSADEDDLVVVIPDVAPIVDAATAAVLPQIPTFVGGAMAAVGSEEMRQAMREAQREIRRVRIENREEFERAMREARRAQAQTRVVSRGQIETAMREARAAHAQVRVIPRAEIEIAMREARRAVATSPRAIAVSMAHGADGMERGAAGMESGAQRMEHEAERLRDRDYRERQIARARERGETVTHEQLLEAAEGLREGAEGMREGAREMREAAQRMRDGRH